METMAFTDGQPLELARSESAVITIRAIAVTAEGFGFTIGMESLRPWLLPPRLAPEEVLVPGQPMPDAGPELVRIDLAFGDGARVGNRDLWPRWTHDEPTRPVLVAVGSRLEQVTVNDRRRGDHHIGDGA